MDERQKGFIQGQEWERVEVTMLQPGSVVGTEVTINIVGRLTRGT